MRFRWCFNEGYQGYYFRYFETYRTLYAFVLCGYLDIKIIRSNLGNEIKGFFQRTIERYEIIPINSELNEHEEKYICAHELGHAILHTNMSLGFFIENSMQVKNRYEIQADKFAAELLIGNDIKEQFYSELSIEQLRIALYVPEKLVRYKLNII